MATQAILLLPGRRVTAYHRGDGMGAVAIGANDCFSCSFFPEQGLMDGHRPDGLFFMAVPADMRLLYPVLKLVPE